MSLPARPLRSFAVQDGARVRRSGTLALVVGIALLGAMALPAGAGADLVTVDAQTQDLTAGDLTQTGRIAFADPGVGSCSGQKPPRTLFSGGGEPAARAYDSYTYTNLTNETPCLSVNLNGGTGLPGCLDEVYSATYTNSFVPADPTANYRADAGLAPTAGTNPTTYVFDVAPEGTFVNVVSAVEPNPDSLCNDYIYTLVSDQPWALTRPTISGTPTVGSGLGFNTGQWAGTPPSNPTLTNQWLRCDTSGANCSVIAGAGGYLVTAGDVGSTLRLRVLAEDGGGVDSTADSAPTAVVPPATTTTTQQGKGGGAKAKCKKKKKKSSASAAKKKKCKKKKKR
jgi:hypothetical protein